MFAGYNQLEALQSPQHLAELGQQPPGEEVFVPQYHEQDAEYHSLEHPAASSAHPSPYHLEGSPEFYPIEHKYQPSHYPKSYPSRGESAQMGGGYLN